MTDTVDKVPFELRSPITEAGSALMVAMSFWVYLSNECNETKDLDSVKNEEAESYFFDEIVGAAFKDPATSGDKAIDEMKPDHALLNVMMAIVSYFVQACFLHKSGNHENAWRHASESQYWAGILNASLADRLADGTLHRCHVEGGTKNGAYVLHLDGKPSGYFEHFKSCSRLTWTLSGKREPMTAAMRQQIEQAKQQCQQEQELSHRVPWQYRKLSAAHCWKSAAWIAWGCISSASPARAKPAACYWRAVYGASLSALIAHGRPHRQRPGIGSRRRQRRLVVSG